MKFTLSWLKDHLETSASLGQITDMLTHLGLEVESVENHAEKLKDFKVARIEQAEQHPNADKLRLCTVNTGAETLKIVCGAANARAGINVVLAREGMTIPANGMVLKKTKIRGVESNGMLCSAHELGLDEDGDGILELPEGTKLGESIVSVLGLDDAVIEIAITPNRSDCLGVHGIARDLAAAGLGTLKELSEIRGQGSEKNTETRNLKPETFTSPVTVSIENTAEAYMFVGYYIKGVKNGPSPEWLQKRLNAIGLRPISTLVDITNLITFEYGRPLHVYDAKLLKGNIRVTRAKNGEKLKALNDKEYTLDDQMIAIADDSGTLGLGGIIGGTSTGVSETTTDVFLECALFNPVKIAETGRKLGLNTDARYRFERGVDPAFAEPGAAIAAQLILDLCGGSASQPTVAGKNPHTAKTIAFNAKRVESLSGVAVSEAECLSILSAIGFTKTPDGITVPSFRPDIEGEADLIEEIVRVKGYNHIPSTPLPVAKGHGSNLLNPLQKRMHVARRLLAARGMLEVTSWSFLSEKEANLFGGAKEALTLANPISADLSVMRPSLLPNLISAAGRNAGRGFDSLSLFEAGAQFEDVTPQGQKPIVAAIRTGSASPRTPYKTDRPVDAFDAKADLFALLEAFGIAAEKARLDRQVPAWYHPQRAGRITLGGKIVLGYFGELHPSVLAAMDIGFPVVGFELLLENIPAPKTKTAKTKPALQVSNFQAVRRDFAFVADAALEVADIAQAISGAEKQLVTDVSVFDIYAGKGVEPGKKSIALSVTLQAMDRTLTDEEIESVSRKILEAAAAKGLALRQ